MKTAVVVSAVLLLFIIGYYALKLLSRNQNVAPVEFLKIESPTASTQYLPTLPSDWLMELEKNWAEKEWSQYDNEYYDISDKICNDVYSSNKFWEKNKTHSDFLNELTDEQRIYFTLINFESQVNNGGVYQFLYNYPELSILALEGMDNVGLDKIAEDYRRVLNEYFGAFDTIQELRIKFQNDNAEWAKRWKAFTEGYDELPSALIIEDYFYEEEYIRTYQAKMTAWVKANQVGLFKTNN